MKSIKINDVEYVAKSEVDSVLKSKNAKPTKVQIVVLQRGWVAIGRFSKKGTECHLTNASIIRRWGTENGLGELADNGPIPANTGNGPTVLDKCPNIHFHELTAVVQMDVNEEVWDSIL